MREALASHWPEYLMEAVELGAFMVSACVFGALLGHPASPLVGWVPDPFTRRALMGIAMGLTAIGIVSSPFGQRSGGHVNPALTIAFFRLGKIAPWDACFYVVAQLAGGLAGMFASAWALGALVAHPAVNYVVTVPGPAGEAVAFAAESAISFGLMAAVLIVGNRPAWARATPLVAGVLVALYITFEAPLSGMSMNPARTIASAWTAHRWSSIWIYCVAPPLGMVAAAELYARFASANPVRCAKLHHHNRRRCIFRCGAAPSGG